MKGTAREEVEVQAVRLRHGVDRHVALAEYHDPRQSWAELGGSVGMPTEYLPEGAVAVGEGDDTDVAEVQTTDSGGVSQEAGDNVSIREATLTPGGTYKVHPHLADTIIRASLRRPTPAVAPTAYRAMQVS